MIDYVPFKMPRSQVEIEKNPRKAQRLEKSRKPEIQIPYMENESLNHYL